MWPTAGVHLSVTSMPRLLTLLVLFLTAVPSTRSAPLGVTRTEGRTRLLITPHILDPERPARRDFGSLRLLGAWRLRSADARLGGVSAMAAEPGGLLALSDSGTVMHIALKDGRPAALRLHGLPDGPGLATRKSDRDTEALAIDPRTGRAWVTFEIRHQVRRYAPAFSRAEAWRRIQRPRRWRMNGGVEAMARLNDGRFLLFSETRRGPGRTSDLLIYSGDPTAPGIQPRRVGYLPPGPLEPTDAAVLGEGRVLVLHRHFSLRSGVWAMLGVIDPTAPAGPGPVRPRLLASWGPNDAIDNMEALAVTREDGREVVWMASDDNFNPLQRTLLLKFALAR